jgi:hypothetical protein
MEAVDIKYAGEFLAGDTVGVACTARICRKPVEPGKGGSRPEKDIPYWYDGLLTRF